MPLPTRKVIPHVPPEWVSPGSFFFLTLCTQPRGENLLARPIAGEAIVAAARHYHEAGDWFCARVTVMPDHVHAIAAFPMHLRMGRWVRKFKIYVARASESVCWQRDFFDHRLRSLEQLRLKIEYVRQNPVRAGLAATPEDWPWQWSGWDG